MPSVGSGRLPTFRRRHPIKTAASSKPMAPAAYCGSTHARKIEEHSNKEKDDQQCRAYAAPDRDSLHVDLDVLAHGGPPQ
jgi:hypothetical protein